MFRGAPLLVLLLAASVHHARAEARGRLLGVSEARATLRYGQLSCAVRSAAAHGVLCSSHCVCAARAAQAPDTGSGSRACDAALLSGSSDGALFCNRWAFNGTAFVRLPTLTPLGNIDPPLGSFFPADARVPSNAQVGSMAGLRLVPQRGWGGGPNVSLGSQTGVVWGVHSTPSTSGGSGAGAAVLLSWHLGGAALNDSAASGPLVATRSPAAFTPSGTTFAANVTYSSRTAAFGAAATTVRLTPTCLRYRRQYSTPATLGFVYTSPLVCHALLSGLSPGTSYAYAISAAVTTGAAGTTTYGTPADSTRGALPFSVTTPPARRSPPAASAYPQRWVVMSDVGETYNSSLTAQYVGAFMDAVTLDGGPARAGLDLVLTAGDFSYADAYGVADAQRTCAQLGGACSGTNQARTDAWFTMWQPVLGRAAAVHAAGAPACACVCACLDHH